jgi:signal transduction histidine kinase
MFPPRQGDTRPPGYLYVVLDGGARAQTAGQLSPWRSWRGAGLVAVLAMVLTLLVGAFALRRLTLPLHRLAATMRDHGNSALHAKKDAGTDAKIDAETNAQANAETPAAKPKGKTPLRGDEVRVIERAFSDMTQRIEAQNQRERQQACAHREMMASVAHDLRTPLTALHGHLEALASAATATTPSPPVTPAEQRQQRVLAAALSQSNRVRRLSQQLFELAALQASDQVLQRERFSLDELVSDAVQKFELTAEPARVTLGGAAPGRLELDGDLQLIERALSNLIDNAMQHAPGTMPVRVSLRREGQQAHIWVEDNGPGLPAELLQRLQSDQSVRDPPPRRATTKTNGGIGGLGLAIAQRVAMLHGGSLRPLPAPDGGTRLCLALPMAG